MTINGVGSSNNKYQSLLLDFSPKATTDNTRIETPRLAKPVSDSTNITKSGKATPSISLSGNTEVSKLGSSQETTRTRSPQQIISSLATLKNNPAKFAAEVNKILQNNDERGTLISHFKLDSPTNKKNLGIAMFLEAGQGLHKDHMMPVGAVILNRALANNLSLAASGKSKVFSISDIVRERNQFAIKTSYNSALNSDRNTAVTHGTGSTVQSMVNDLSKGQVGGQPKSETAFFFQRATLRNQTFKAGSHSFSQTPSSVQYVNGNYLVGAGNRGYYQK